MKTRTTTADPIPSTRHTAPIRGAIILTAVLFATLAQARAEEKPHEPEIVPPYGPVVDEHPGLFAIPEKYREKRDFTVAEQSPRITFSTFRGLSPLRLKKGDDGLWALWGEGVWASNGKYYTGIGDHRGIDANCYLYEYDPETHQHKQVLDMAVVVGQKPGDFGHGKLHGRIDEDDTGRLTFATYWGAHPDHLPEKERNAIGGRLVRYNIYSGRIDDLGMPLLGDSFPMHATDTKRMIFHGLGLYDGYVAYDLNKRETLYSGQLPEGITWDKRATLIDPNTGCCYGSSMSGDRRIVKYDPRDNTFSKTKAAIPDNPHPEIEKKPFIRSYTSRRLEDGSFIAQTYDGLMFKFFPDTETTELIGPNWDKGLYATSMALTSDNRYLYYTVGAHGSTWETGSPIIRMDTRDYSKKVVAFLHPYYQEKHGYVFGGSYSLTIDAEDKCLMIAWNGRFRKAEETGESFGHPSFMHIQLPQE